MKILRKIAGVCLCAALLTSGATASAPLNTLNEGTFEASAVGYGGELSVSLTTKDGKIGALAVTKNGETPEYGGRAVAALPATIVEKNSLGVDAVSGATITSRAILRASAEAIRQAGGDPASFGYVPIEDLRAASTIVIEGLPDGKAATFTGSQLMNMPSMDVDTLSITSSDKKTPTKATGVTLETVLGSLGVSQKDLSSVVLSATDGYSIAVPRDVLQKRDILIAWTVNGEPQSLRTVIPDERALYWVKFLSKIELHADMPATACDTVYLLDTMIAQLPEAAADYPYGGSTDRAMPIQALFAKFIEPQPEFVGLAATDSWAKSEKFATVIAQSIKFTGPDAPVYIGPNLPEGMRMKHLLLLQLNNVTILSLPSAEAKLSLDAGVPLQNALSLTGIADSPAYKLLYADGTSQDVTVDALQDCMLTLSEGGVYTTSSNLSLPTSPLLKIIAIQGTTP